MNIDEAIKHCEEVAKTRCDKCSVEHKQLAEWIKELKELREKTKWHIVSEGDLPDDNDICQVLACQRDGSMNIVTGLTVCNSKKIFAAWMPLPKSY